MNAVITGGTKGIGKAVAESLLAEGYNVGICSRSQEDIDDLTKDWRVKYPKSTIVGKRCDMSLTGEITDFAQSMLKQLGAVDVLVNNAGIFIPGEILVEAEGALDQMMKVNLLSAYHLTRKIAPQMVERGSGHIFNMCSVASIMAYPNGGSYSISKFALLGFSKVLREELKPTGVKVTAIVPGATWSNSWAGVDLPKDRLMEANDIAISISSALKMSPSAVVEEIIVRPQLGDL